jgi:hypothetical protein
MGRSRVTKAEERPPPFPLKWVLSSGRVQQPFGWRSCVPCGGNDVASLQSLLGSRLSLSQQQVEVGVQVAVQDHPAPSSRNLARTPLSRRHMRTDPSSPLYGEGRQSRNPSGVSLASSPFRPGPRKPHTPEKLACFRNGKYAKTRHHLQLLVRNKQSSPVSDDRSVVANPASAHRTRGTWERVQGYRSPRGVCSIFGACDWLLFLASLRRRNCVWNNSLG